MGIQDEVCITIKPPKMTKYEIMFDDSNIVYFDASDIENYFGISYYDVDYNIYTSYIKVFLAHFDCAFYCAEKHNFYPTIAGRRICEEEGKSNLYSENLS